MRKIILVLALLASSLFLAGTAPSSANTQGGACPDYHYFWSSKIVYRYQSWGIESEYVSSWSAPKTGLGCKLTYRPVCYSSMFNHYWYGPWKTSYRNSWDYYSPRAYYWCPSNYVLWARYYWYTAL